MVIIIVFVFVIETAEPVASGYSRRRKRIGDFRRNAATQTVNLGKAVGNLEPNKFYPVVYCTSSSTATRW